MRRKHARSRSHLEKVKRWAPIWVAFVVVLSFSVHVYPADIPDDASPTSTASSPWPMFRHDLNHTGQSPYDTSQNSGDLIWKFTTGKRIESSPVIGPDNTIYIGSWDGKMYAIDVDGNQLWNYSIGQFGAVTSTPAISSDNTIYFGSYDSNIYALFLNGTLKWNFSTDWASISSPAIAPDGTVYVGSSDCNLYAIYPDGTLKWKFPTGYWVDSSPAIGVDGTIYVGSDDGNLYAVNSNGTSKWIFATGDTVNSSPAIDPNGTVYFGSDDKNLYALNPDGTLKWNYTTGDWVNSPAIALDGTIYVGSGDHNLYALNPDGTLRWNYTADGLITSSPAIGSEGTIYIGSYDSNLYAIHPNGTLKWKFKTEAWVHSTPAIGSDGTIYVGSLDNNLYAIGPAAPNQPPVADAGPDQTVNEGDTVQFDGRNSSGSAEKSNISVEGNVVVNLPGYVHDWISGVAVDQDGVLYAAWHADELKFAKSSDDKSFESHKGVAPAASNYQKPFIHADSNGTVYIVYGCPVKDGNDICFVKSNDGGKAFGNAIEVNDDWGNSVQANPSMLVDTHGSIYVVWYDTRNGLWDVYFSKSTDGGSSFSPNVRVNGDSRDFPRAYPPSPALSIDDNGTIYVAWMDNRNMDFDVYFSKSSDNGTSFEPDLRVNDDLGDADQRWPSMVVDQKGLIHLVWDDERDGFRALYHAQSVDGGKNFSTNRKLTLEPETMYMRMPRIAITNLGSLCLVWMGGSGSDADVFITASIDAGISFLPGTRVNNDTGTHEQRYPEVVVDDADSAHIVWSDGRNHQLGQSWDVYYAKGHLEGGHGTRIASYEWDFDASIDSDGDGNYTNDVEVTGPTPTHIYYDDGFYVVTLTVTDESGLSDTDTCNITVLNVPPTPEWTSRSSDGTMLSPPYPEGKEILFEATVYDPGIYDTFTYDWDFGDGTILLDAGPSVTHTYGDDDIYIVVLTVTDDDGGVGIDDTPPLDTTNENPGASIDMPFCIFTEGTYPCEAIGQFTDPGWLDTHSAVWDYGDGTYETAVLTEENDPPDATGWNITSHIYGDDGVYNITFTVVDDDGGVGTASAEAQVQNLPPSVDMIAPSTVNEGEDFVLGITATDPGSDDLTVVVDWGDGTSETAVYYNNGIGPDPPNSGEGVYPFTVYSNLTHAYGDNGNFTVQVTIEDDDGGSVQEIVTADVLNLPPQVGLPTAPLIFEEGEDFSLTATATDPGSDDLEFTWSFELGPSFTSLYYNDGTGPDPPLSPWGTFPFSAEDTVAHTYGDNGLYDVTITVSDDDGGSSASTLTIEVVNVEPSVDIGGPYAGNENSPIEFTATATDPGSDDLTFIWDWGDGTTDAMAFYNDGMSNDPPKSPWGTYPFEATHTVSHIWGDNGNFTVTLTVTDDDGGISVQQTEVIVNNVAPSIDSIRYFLNASFSFRIAGEKWHNVEIHLYEDGNEIGYANITRYPGSPNDQMVTLADISIDFSKTYSAVAYYTPEDDPVNGQIWGATPAWVILEYEDGEERIHHTFNVRHEDTWTWVIDDFSPYFLGHNITFVAAASDPGSDDLTFTWNWGDGNTTENTYYNDGIGPDPYPSPEVNPAYVTDEAEHSYTSAGTYVITLTVTDDDGGVASYTFNLTL